MFIKKNTVFLFIIFILHIPAIAQMSTNTADGQIYSRMMSAEMNQSATKSELDSFLNGFSNPEITYNTTSGYISTSFHSHVSYVFGDDAPALIHISVTPSTAAPNTNFKYSATYLDADNPASAPKLYVHYNDNNIAGSPFTMALESGSDPTVGLVYTYTVLLATVSNNYSYYVTATDAFNKTTITPEIAGPVVNNPPVIAWLNAEGYGTDGLHPEYGVHETTFTYKVVYTDSDGHAPKTGYPKLYIYANEHSVSGSPFSMQFSSGTYYSTGATYAYSVLLSTGIAYSYKIECYDQLNGSYTLTGTGPKVFVYAKGWVKDPLGEPIKNLSIKLSKTSDTSYYYTNDEGYFQCFISTENHTLTIPHSQYIFSPSSYSLQNATSHQLHLNFTRASRNPSIAFTGESGYITNALNLERIEAPNPAVFRMRYADPDGDAVNTAYPKLTILKSGATVQTVIMSFDSGSYASSVIFSTAVYVLEIGTYTYTLSAQDLYGAFAPTTMTGSFIIYSPAPDVPSNISLAAKDNAVVVSGKVCLSWMPCSSTKIITYTLFLSDPQDIPFAPSFFHARHATMNAVYVGTAPFCTVSGLSPGKLYSWQVKSVDPYGATSLSPVYSFKTLATTQATKAFNYPNPFNPAIGETTNIVFEMKEAGDAVVDIYSEYGDLCWSGVLSAVPIGTNELNYNGRDGSGALMYNGTYVCIIKKKYATREEKDFCRILIVK